MKSSKNYLALIVLLFLMCVAWVGAQGEKPPLRLGMIGLDTSHVTAFTQLLNDPTRPDHVPGARVVAAFKGGSPDVRESATRIERFTSELKDKWGVQLVDSIEELCKRVDAVLIESVDGRPHLQQARPVLEARKRLFIDKPMTASYRDAVEIARLARLHSVPVFSASSRRFAPEIQNLRTDARVGKILGAESWGHSPIVPHMPDLFWYGVHSVESLYALMGPGCESVTRVSSDGADLVVGRWKDGRIGVVRAIREGSYTYGAIAFGDKAIVTSTPTRSNYRELVVEIIKFFETGISPVPLEETVETIAFMEAADLSKKRNGAPVSLSEIR